MKNRGSLIAFLLLLGLALSAGAYMVAPFIQAFLVGCILTLIMLPFYRFLRKRRIGPRYAAAIATLAMVFIIVGPCLVFAAIAVKQAVGISQVFVGMEHMSLEDFLTKISAWEPLRYFSIDPSELDALFRQLLQYLGAAGTKLLLNIARTIPQGILQLVLACLTCFCLLTDGRRFAEWVFGRIPMDQEIRRRMTAAFEDTAISTVMASMAVAGAQSALMIVAFLVLDVPNVFLGGGATFILAWIPIFGSSPIWLASAAYLYFQGSLTQAIIMLVFGAAIGTVDNFIRPLILKGRGEMHPLVSLVAIFGGLQWFGFSGVFLGPILAAVVISLLQLWPMVGRPFGLVFAGDDSARP